MSPRVPEAVREAWGDELVAEVVPWLEQIVEEKAVLRDEYREVFSRLGIIEHDLSDIKTQIHELRTEVRSEIHELRTEVRSEIHELRAAINDMQRHFEARLDQMNERMLVQTRWLIGSIVLFGTILSILTAIGQFKP
jgi:chromosome segregation ATPase